MAKNMEYVINCLYSIGEDVYFKHSLRTATVIGVALIQSDIQYCVTTWSEINQRMERHWVLPEELTNDPNAVQEAFKKRMKDRRPEPLPDPTLPTV